MTHRPRTAALTLLTGLLMLSLASACAEPDPAADAAETDRAQSSDAAAALDTAAVMKADWAYEGAGGPEAWGTIAQAYAACGEGQEQSPIALRGQAATEADLPPLQFDYGAESLAVKDAGYGYKATPGGDHTLAIGDETYRLLQFHAHTPSEHTIGGEYYPMTLHFVHQNDAGELAVVGVMVEEGAEHAAYTPFVEAARSGAQGTAAVDSLETLLPQDRAYFTYDGSLTTPPCTEGVRWIVLREPVTLSQEQLDVFAEAHGETNRPLQPLGSRIVRVSQ